MHNTRITTTITSKSHDKDAVGKTKYRQNKNLVYRAYDCLHLYVFLAYILHMRQHITRVSHVRVEISVQVVKRYSVKASLAWFLTMISLVLAIGFCARIPIVRSTQACATLA